MTDSLCTKNEKMLGDLFDELVPPSGKAESKAGEIVRAVSRIGYRFINDGDHIGIGYGKETCNAPARFLMMECDMKVGDVVSRLWGLPFTDEYEMYLGMLSEAVLEFLKEHPELRTEPTKDMYDYQESEDLEWCDDDDDDEEYEDYSEGDDEDIDF